MPRPARPVNWEEVNPKYWSSSIGYITLNIKDNIWTAHAYRNLSTGTAWIEKRSGYTSASEAIRWIERTAED